MEYFSNLSITGSVGITDNLSVDGNIIGTASLASVAALANTASYALTASYVIANDTGNATVLLSGSKPQEELPSGSLWYNTELSNLYIQTTTPSGSKYQQVINEKLTPFTYSGSGGITLSGSNNNPYDRADIILGGTNQATTPGSTLSFIGNGSGNEIQKSGYSTILNGTNSWISHSNAAVITNGGNNQIKLSNYSVVQGYSNKILSDTSINITNTIAGGEINLISQSRASFIFGRGNKITGSYDSYIIGRSSNVTHNNAHVFGYNLDSIQDNTVHVENLYAKGELLGTASYAITALNGGVKLAVSETRPTDTVSGSLWYNEMDGNLYVQVGDPTGSSYVPTTTSIPGGTYGSTIEYTGTGSNWTIDHNLNTETPLVQVYSGSFVMQPSDIEIVDSSRLIITFAEPTNGTAVISTGIRGVTSASYAVNSVSSSYAATTDYFEWSAKETTVVEGTTTNPTKGAVYQDYTRYRRINSDTYEVHWNLTFSGAGGVGSGDYLFSLPSGLTWHPDWPVYASPITNFGLIQNVAIPTIGVYTDDAGNRFRDAVALPYDSTRFRVMFANSGIYSGLATSDGYDFAKDGWSVNIRFYTNN